MSRVTPPGERLLTPGEAAAILGLDPHTLNRWAHMRKLTPIRTPGGNRRYREAEIEALAKAPGPCVLPGKD